MATSNDDLETLLYQVLNELRNMQRTLDDIERRVKRIERAR